MPNTRVISTTVVEFTKDEADKLIAEHMPALSPDEATLSGGKLTFSLNQQAIAKVLAEMIPGLPAKFSIAQVNGNPKIALRVTFLTP